jgi:hypothetical protein
MQWCYYITAWVGDVFSMVQFKVFLSFLLAEGVSERALSMCFNALSTLQAHQSS